ncbi:dihydrolipoyllysine-residue acetyltransferase [Microdochium nivale]|nr:dihydrolipoyllysine-residue acetyltransferase [Microdochium nivale]
MDELATADAPSGDSAAASSRGRTELGGGAQADGKLPEVNDIVTTGDLILAVTFENSKSTVRAARKAQAQIPPVSTKADKVKSAAAPPAARARTRVPFRVQASVLKRQSQYFDRLLGDSRFKEAKDITAVLEALSLRNIKPGDAIAAELPWVEITDDDEATQYAHRELVFADLLRILHDQPALTGSSSTHKVTPQYVTTLAVLADRFDCTAPVSSHVSARLKYKWPTAAAASRKVPPASGRGGDETSGLNRPAEDILRQKILVGWLLNLPIVFKNGTKELILSGSSRWGSFAPEDEQDQHSQPEAAWWYLPEGLEEELQYRRQCVLNTVAGIQQHFLALYSSRSSPRQCKLGYDSSAACDSYQLGEIVRFLANKSLLFLVDFSPGSLDRIVETPRVSVDSLLATLRQCPSYQVDKNHNNCGLRTRMLPVLDFVQGLIGTNAVPVTTQGWRTDRAQTAWLPLESDGEGATSISMPANGGRPEFSVPIGTVPSHHDGGDRSNGYADADGDSHHRAHVSGGAGHPHGKPFRFTRTMAGDQRLRLDGALGLDKLARQVFLASSWDWTADDDAASWSNPGKMGRVPLVFK